MRKEFKLTNKQWEDLLRASKPVPYMVFGGRPPMSPQEEANNVWKRLGKEMGFKPITVKPVKEKDNTYFTAEIEEKEKP